ncbi:putative sensor domain DACNV-containing protein [Schlesneria paludicola]|uniref:putative sensor domain DACNV-containing protein n=1 Tax=Schlesneria paludicola TaxID=360056 RepID=UPI00029A2A1D|nr:hypothetical protein [Schlesneria paludicola]
MTHLRKPETNTFHRHEAHHQPPSHDTFEGPEELTSKLMPYFDADVAGIDDLLRLIKLLYHASLIPEEGRYPQFRAICGNETFGHTVEFDAPWPSMNSVEAIRRIAPAISDPNTAVRIVGDARRGFSACQILDFREHSVRGDVEAINEGSLPEGTLTVRVDGPGELRATIQPGPVFHLRGNKIRELIAFDKAVLPFRARVRQLCERFQRSLDERASIPGLSAELLVDGFLYLWATMMADVINSPNGGAFLIVPQRDCSCVEPRFRADGNLFRAFETTIVTLTQRSGKNLAEGRKQWLLQREHLLRVARMYGRLSATDGAVLFDSELCLYGFGAKISGAVPTLPLHDAVTGNLLDDGFSSGMRHRSAAEFVRAVPGAIAFVISQDGDLSAFYNDDTRAYRLTNLDAWGTVSDFL